MDTFSKQFVCGEINILFLLDIPVELFRKVEVAYLYCRSFQALWFVFLEKLFRMSLLLEPSIKRSVLYADSQLFFDVINHLLVIYIFGLRLLKNLK